MNCTLSSGRLGVNTIVKQLLIIFLAIFFFLSGPASLWADCFRHTHAHSEDHHDSNGLSAVSSDATDDNDSAARFHCPPVQFDLDAVSSTITTSKPSPTEYTCRLARDSGLAADEFSLATQSRWIETRLSVSYPYLIDISPHLLLSVFRI